MTPWTKREIERLVDLTLEMLKDQEKPMEVPRALAVAAVAQQLIQSAKVEIAFIKATDAAIEGQFFDSPIDEPKPRPALIAGERFR
jgi:hypothetical protein